MVSITTILPFNTKEIGKNPCSVFWQFHNQQRRKLYHTQLGHGTKVETSISMGQGPLQRDKWLGCCGVILSQRTTKIPSSLNKLVPRRSKKTGKTKRENKGRSSNHDWLVIIFYCISYMNYHFHVCFFSVRTETYSSVSVCCCGFLQAFFFSSCDPVSSCRTDRDKIFATV